MIYRKDEFVSHDEEDKEFPIKQIDRLEPIDGSASRFIGRATLNMMTRMGVQQIPVSFEIDAAGVEEAFAKYVEMAKPKIEEFKEHLQERIEEMRREEQSRIVTPGEAAGGGIIQFDDFSPER
jgi:hypothetical protein